MTRIRLAATALLGLCLLSCPLAVRAGELGGEASAADENEAGEADAPLPPVLRAARVLIDRPRIGAAKAQGVRIRDLPDAPALLAQALDAIRGREVDLTLLASRKYMINGCLGIKVSAGSFKMKLANPGLRIEGSGLVFDCGIEKIVLSAVKLRMKPNAGNPLELCKFSKKFAVEGVAKDVKFELRFDPIYELSRCQVLDYGEVKSRVTIGELNLKPLQNDLDRMAKNMVEDAINTWVLGSMASTLMDWIQKPLRQNCPQAVREAGDAVGDALGGGGEAAPDPAGEAGDEGLAARVEALELQVEALAARLAQLEGGAPAAPEPAPATDPGPAADPPAGGEPGTAAAEPPMTRPAGAGPAGPGYTVEPSPELVGRLGRVIVAFPKDSKANPRVGIKPVGGADEVASDHGGIRRELMPGRYDVTIGGRLVPAVEVRARHDTRLKVGVVRLHSAQNARFGIREPGGEVELQSTHGSAEIGLPVGAFEVEVGGVRTPVTIEEGKAVEF